MCTCALPALQAETESSGDDMDPEVEILGNLRPVTRTETPGHVLSIVVCRNLLPPQ